MIATGLAVPVQASRPRTEVLFPNKWVAEQNAESATLADVDGDGRLDLIARGGGTYSGFFVSVLRANGDGSFQPAENHPVGSSWLFDLAAADLDGDGAPEIVGTRSDPPGVVVLPNAGDGSFGPSLSLAAGAAPWHVALADLNGDGAVDLVTASPATDEVDVRLGDGALGFGPATTFAVGDQPEDLAIADLDGDGHPDLATANFRGRDVTVLRGNGDGTFGPPIFSGVGGRPTSLAIGDLDENGVPDLVTGSSIDYTVSVLRGFGDGFFYDQWEQPEGLYFDVTLADVDGDAHLDLVAASGGVALGRGDGSFEPPVAFASVHYPTSLAVGALNDDASPDVALTDLDDRRVTVLLGNGDGSFDGQVDLARGFGSWTDAVAAGDLDGDGHLDLVTLNNGSDDLSVLLGLGSRRFAEAVSYPTGAQPNALTLADVDGDGILDALVSRGSFSPEPVHAVSVLRGRGDGGFDPPASTDVGQYPIDLAVADLDGDGALDVVTVDFVSNAVDVLRNDGAGGFLHAGPFAAGSSCESVAIGDVDGDGVPDVVTANRFDRNLSVLLGNGDGTLGPAALLASGGDTPDVALADLDGDGALDIAATVGHTEIAVLLGDGSGGFGAPLRSVTGFVPERLAVGDLDGDGLLDLTTNHFYPGYPEEFGLNALIGRGDGTFEPPVKLEMGSPGRSDAPNAVLAIDLDRDGGTDLAATHYNYPSLTVLFNRFPPTLEASIDIRPGSDPNRVSPLGWAPVRVALFGSEELDASLVDVGSLGFGPGGAPALQPRVRDVDQDGFDDLLVSFVPRESGLAMGDGEACLSGRLDLGRQVGGCDAIVTVESCGDGFALALVAPPLLWAGRRWRRAAVAGEQPEALL